MELFTFKQLPPDDPWNQCLAHYFESLEAKSHSQNTVIAYNRMLREFFGTGVHPEQVSRSLILEFLGKPTRKGFEAGASTRNLRLTVLTSFYAWASAYTIGSGLSLWNKSLPTAGIKRSARPTAIHALTAAQLTRLFEIIPTDTVIGLRDRSIYLFYFWTARRREEIARLTWGDIEQAVIVEQGGTRREGWVYHFRGKGRVDTDDMAELPEPAKAALDQYLAASSRQVSMKPEDPLWTSVGPEYGGTIRPENHPLTGDAMLRRLKFYAKQAGLSEKISLHWLRHTSARERYAAGSDIREIQKLLRHSSLATTDMYLRVLTNVADPGASLLMEKFGQL